MAEHHDSSGAGARHTQADGSNPVATLQPQEYLTWLRDVELSHGVDGVRAYLVSRDAVTNARRITPVRGDECVLNIERDLLSYLTASPASKDLIARLLTYCVEHGRRDTLCDLPGEFGERANIARRAAYAIEDVVEVMQRFEVEDFEGAATRVLLNKLHDLAGVVMSAVNDAGDTVEDMRTRAGCLEEVNHE